MFFRTKTTPSGQVVQLIEAYRDSLGRSRNRVVISLGNCKIPEESKKAVASAVQRHLYNDYYQTDELFEWLFMRFGVFFE